MQLKSIVMLNSDPYGGYQLVDFPNGDGDYDIELFDTKEDAHEYLKRESYILFGTLEDDEIYYIEDKAQS